VLDRGGCVWKEKEKKEKKEKKKGTKRQHGHL
jgi:hypothetical protein